MEQLCLKTKAMENADLIIVGNGGKNDYFIFQIEIIHGNHENPPGLQISN